MRSTTGAGFCPLGSSGAMGTAFSPKAARMIALQPDRVKPRLLGVRRRCPVLGSGIPATNSATAETPRDLGRLRWHGRCSEALHGLALAGPPLRAPHAR